MTGEFPAPGRLTDRHDRARQVATRTERLSARQEDALWRAIEIRKAVRHARLRREARYRELIA